MFITRKELEVLKRRVARLEEEVAFLGRTIGSNTEPQTDAAEFANKMEHWSQEAIDRAKQAFTK